MLGADPDLDKSVKDVQCLLAACVAITNLLIVAFLSSFAVSINVPRM